MSFKLSALAVAAAAVAVTAASAAPTFSQSAFVNSAVVDAFNVANRGPVTSVSPESISPTEQFTVGVTGFTSPTPPTPPSGALLVAGITSTVGSTTTATGAVLAPATDPQQADDATVTSNLVDNGNGTSTLTLVIAAVEDADGAEFLPAGFALGGNPITSIRFDLGFNAGGTGIDFLSPVDFSDIVASVDVLSDGAVLAGPFSFTILDLDASPIAAITSGPVESFVGVTSISAGGSNLAGAGIDGFRLTLTVPTGDVIPEPASLGLLSVVGLGLVRRRR